MRGPAWIGKNLAFAFDVPAVVVLSPAGKVVTHAAAPVCLDPAAIKLEEG